MMFKQGQKNNQIIKRILENKNNQSNHSKQNDKQKAIRQRQRNVIHPKESKIEIVLKS